MHDGYTLEARACVVAHQFISCIGHFQSALTSGARDKNYHRQQEIKVHRNRRGDALETRPMTRNAVGVLRKRLRLTIGSAYLYNLAALSRCGVSEPKCIQRSPAPLTLRQTRLARSTLTRPLLLRQHRSYYSPHRASECIFTTDPRRRRCATSSTAATAASIYFF